MKIYIKSTKSSNSKPEKSGYTWALRQNCPGCSYGPDRVLDTIRRAITSFPNCNSRVHIPADFKKRAGNSGVVVLYSGTLQELQQDVCKIIKDTAKQDDVKLYPQIKSNTVTYHPIDVNGDRTKDTVTFSFEQVTIKDAQKYKETYGVDTYIIRLER